MGSIIDLKRTKSRYCLWGKDDDRNTINQLYCFPLRENSNNENVLKNMTYYDIIVVVAAFVLIRNNIQIIFKGERCLWGKTEYIRP